MKRIFQFLFGIIAIVMLHTAVRAQDSKEVSLSDLQAPYSPAFVLLDVAPTLIERPTTAKAFATSLINSVAQNNGIPENYAVEFTPFWFFKHKTFTAYKYYGIKPETGGNNPFSSTRMTAVSLALVNKEAVDSTIPQSSNIAFGIRATILKFTSAKDRQLLVQRNNAIVRKLAGAATALSDRRMDIYNNKRKINEIREKMGKEPDAAVRAQQLASISVLEMNASLLELKASFLLDSVANDPGLTQAEEQLKEVLARRPWLTLDGAAAINWAFTNYNVKSSNLDRAGAWLTLNLSFPLSKSSSEVHKYYISLYLSGRYMSGRLPDTEDKTLRQDCLDSGGKLELDLNRFVLSYEYMYRNNFTVTSDHSFRSSGLMKYKIADALFLTAAFGKNFGNANNLIAQLGINWSLASGNEHASTAPDNGDGVK